MVEQIETGFRSERTYQLYAAEAARFNPELLPWIPVGNLRRAMCGKDFSQQDAVLIEGDKAGVWSLSCRLPDETPKCYRLYVSPDENFPDLPLDEYSSVILRRPDVRWKDGTLAFGGLGSARTWADLNEELDAPLEGFALA